MQVILWIYFPPTIRNYLEVFWVFLLLFKFSTRVLFHQSWIWRNARKIKWEQVWIIWLDGNCIKFSVITKVFFPSSLCTVKDWRYWHYARDFPFYSQATFVTLPAVVPRCAIHSHKLVIKRAPHDVKKKFKFFFFLIWNIYNLYVFMFFKIFFILLCSVNGQVSVTIWKNTFL